MRGAFPNTVYQKWVEMVKADTGMTVTCRTVGGPEIWQSRMLARETDLSVSGQPMPESATAAGNVLRFSVLIGAVVPMFNRPAIDPDKLRLNGARFGPLAEPAKQRVRAVLADGTR